MWVSVSWLGVTCREGVTNISSVTLADGIVVLHRTCGVGSTHILAWVTTLVVVARLVGRTVWIGCAFMLAFNVWIAFKTRQADAGSCLVLFLTLCIDSTRICVAGIDDLWANGSYWRDVWANGSYWRDVWAFCGAFKNFVYKMGCNLLYRLFKGF